VSTGSDSTERKNWFKKVKWPNVFNKQVSNITIWNSLVVMKTYKEHTDQVTIRNPQWITLVIQCVWHLQMPSLTRLAEFKTHCKNPCKNCSKSPEAGTLAINGWAVTFGTARIALGGLLPSPLLAVPNVTAHPSTAILPISSIITAVQYDKHRLTKQESINVPMTSPNLFSHSTIHWIHCEA